MLSALPVTFQDKKQGKAIMYLSLSRGSGVSGSGILDVVRKSFLILSVTLISGLFSISADAHSKDEHEHQTDHLNEQGPVKKTIEKGHAKNIWGEDYFPNFELTTHNGDKVRFFDDVIKNKVVAINFIYTSCSDVCPAETARLKVVADILGDRMGKDIFFYSITIDPERDTPEVINAYRKKFQIGKGWHFLTGDEEEIRTLRKKMGLYISTINEWERDLSDHNISLVIGNQALGRWVKRSPYENPYVIANQMGGWLHNWKHARASRNRYEDAPEIRQISDGEMKFRNLCTSCHVISGGIAKVPNARQIGPDLFGVVENRDNKWLTRWIMEPDKMLAEKDPIALALLQEYEVVMPNFSLPQQDVRSIIEYMQNETARLKKVAQKREQEKDVEL